MGVARCQRLFNRRDLKLLPHAFGSHVTGAFWRAAGEVLRAATAAFVAGNGELGFAIVEIFRRHDGNIVVHWDVI